MKKLVLIMSLFAGAAACGKKEGGVGVPECDQYLTKVRACAKKVGGQIGGSLERGAKMFEGVWVDNAKDAAMKAELPKTCSEATASAKKQFTQCEW